VLSVGEQSVSVLSKSDWLVLWCHHLVVAATLRKPGACHASEVKNHWVTQILETENERIINHERSKVDAIPYNTPSHSILPRLEEVDGNGACDEH
jgi:hypothetical protein